MHGRRDQVLQIVPARRARVLRGLRIELDPTAFGVATGSFDHPEEFQPTNVHCGIESQMPWLKIDDGLPRKTTGEAMGYEVES